MVYFPFSSSNSVASDLPDQKGANGKFLTTNGSEASWAAVSDATKVYGCWVLNSNKTADTAWNTNTVIDNWVANITAQGISVDDSEGTFVFSRTGLYKVEVTLRGYSTVDIEDVYSSVINKGTTDKYFSYAFKNLGTGDDTRTFTLHYGGIIDVTNVSTQKLNIIGFCRSSTSTTSTQWAATDFYGGKGCVITIFNVD